MSKKFNPLDYSRGWDDYWRDHPQGYSPQEQMINWSGQLNAMIDFFNQYFDVDLTEYATDVMEGWYFDGRLDDIINEVLFDSKADKTTVNALLAETTAHLADNVPHFSVPTAPELVGKNIEIVSGVLRQNKDDRSKWDVLDDSGHTPIGISVSQATASGGSITLPFTKRYSKVLGFSAGPDEYYANAHSITVGASVGFEDVTFKMGGSIHGAGLIYYDGTEWVVTEGEAQNIVSSVPTFSSGNLTVLHGYCPGNGLQISPSGRGGAVIPHMPIIRAISNVGFNIMFVDTTTGEFVLNPDIKMAFQYSKTYSEGLHLDGTVQSDQLNLDLGNIWFMGIFEV